jgi:hypothetical protein
MGLSKHATEEVERELKELFFAYVAGYSHGTTFGTPDPRKTQFKAWLDKNKPDLTDYFTEQKHAEWYPLARTAASS